MCDPITAITMGIGALSSVMGAAAQNKNLAAQAEGVDRQLAREYVESQFETRSEKEAALKTAYNEEITRRQAVGSARVQGAAMGIRGHTAGELIGAESQIGSMNVNTAMDRYRSSDAASLVGMSLSRASAIDQVDSLKSQMVSPFGMLMGAVGGATGGYSKGLDIKSSLSDPYDVMTGA